MKLIVFESSGGIKIRIMLIQGMGEHSICIRAIDTITRTGIICYSLFTRFIFRIIVDMFGEKMRDARLMWIGHIERRMLRMEQPRQRKRGRHTRRFVDAVTEDVAVVEVTKEDAEDRNKRSCKTHYGDP